MTEPTALERFEEAVRAHEMKGGGDPAYWGEIDSEYEAAKQVLNQVGYGPVPLRREGSLMQENPIIVITVEADSPDQFAHIRRTCVDRLNEIPNVDVKAFSWLVEPSPELEGHRK